MLMIQLGIIHEKLIKKLKKKLIANGFFMYSHLRLTIVNKHETISTVKLSVFL